MAWAAAGKDAGFTPQFLLEEAQRLARYPASLLAEIQLREPVDLKTCKQAWLTALADAHALFERLPAEEVGCLYLDANRQPVTPHPGTPEFSRLTRHFGSVRGAWPVISDQTPEH